MSKQVCCLFFRQMYRSKELKLLASKRLLINSKMLEHSGHFNQINNTKLNRSTSFQIIKEMLTYIWPKNKPELRRRVIISLNLLISAKVNIKVRTTKMISFSFL